ncbi:MAG: hypothetical protein HOV81_05275 [Kofleriaceae bacterium]|nr:hypothetical protein [Kofleriaceae bacterium]
MRLALLFICASATTAAAEPEFEILDRGEAVEVIAYDIKATSTNIRPIRSRLEIPIGSAARIPKLLPTGEKTIKVVELDGAPDKRVLSVKVGFEHDAVVQLVKHAQAIQVGNDLHVLLPRMVPAAGTSIVLPEPTLPPELVAKAQAIAPVPTTAPVEPKVEPAKPAVAPPAPALEAPKAEAKPEPQPAPVKQPLATATQKNEKSIVQDLPMLLALVLAGLGCFAWMKRKKKTSNEPTSSIEVIAQKGLGAKAKIVWLRAGEREMVVAVTPQAVRMLGSWKKAADEARHAYTTTRESGVFPMPRPSASSLPEAQALAPSSPAVAGILKLRARTNVPQISEDIATDDVDADSLWAKEILAATGARR